MENSDLPNMNQTKKCKTREFQGCEPFNQPVQPSRTKSLANPSTSPTCFFFGLLGWLNQKFGQPKMVKWFTPQVLVYRNLLQRNRYKSDQSQQKCSLTQINWGLQKLHIFSSLASIDNKIKREWRSVSILSQNEYSHNVGNLNIFVFYTTS